MGTEPPGFAARVQSRIELKHDELMRARLKTLNWELFDHAPAVINDLLVDRLVASAQGTPLEGKPADAQALRRLRDDLTPSLAKRLFLWQKTKDDVLQEIDSELQMPGWGNAWTQPIINRVNMLATGVRTQIGVKVFGPTGKPLAPGAGDSNLGQSSDAGAIADVQRVSQEIAAKLKTLHGAVDVVPEQSVGKRYLEITIDRERASRYGVNMSDLSQAVETALGGSRITTTLEGRQRFSVRLRYTRDNWQSLDDVKNILVTAQMTPAQLLDLTNAGIKAMASPEPEIGASPEVTAIQIPLSLVADIHVADGPAMIRSENGRLCNYVTLNVRGRDLLGFVDQAKEAIKPIEAKLAGTGMSIAWSGEYEAQLSANQTLLLIFPMVIVLILFLLYVTFHDFLDTLLAFLAVLGALSGAIMFQAFWGFNRSVVVSIGYISAFGMATQTAVIMLVYLRQALERRGGLAGITSYDELRACVIEGAVHRLRPKLLTEGVAIVGLVPMLWAFGAGAEIMRPMAAPVLGGLLISDEVIDLMIPVLFYWIRRKRWRQIHAPAKSS
jgi:Cu(I)/Ag(I) efflux system membrane protein CusA/SilA